MKAKKLLAIVLTLVMVLSFSAAAFANGSDPEPIDNDPTTTTPTTPGTPGITIHPNNVADDTESLAITYTYYKILSADIDTDPEVGLDGETTTDGVVAYYVEDEDQAAALAGTGVFVVTQVAETNKWYVELAEGKGIDDILTAFNDDTFLANFTEQTYTSEGGDAVLPDITAGYYFIKSSLGSKIIVQTLSPVEINEKNEYVSDDKTVPEVDEHSQIGQEITYTLTVNVPVTVNDQVVLTDTMGKGLTFKEIKSQDPIEGTVSDVTDAANGATKFTITYSAEQIQGLVEDATEAQTITVEVTVIVNEEAAIDTGIPNTLDLKYGNTYEAVPVTVNTETTHFDFDKVDGTDSTTKLTGAEFQLELDGDVVMLIKVEEGKTYRVATAEEIEAEGDALVDTIVTNGNTVTINGLDGDLTYQLVETKAPTGYNKLDDPIDVAPEDHLFVHQDIENNKGATLPSTGGIGTTLFYVVGGMLVAAALVMLITKKRMSREA